MQGSMGMVIAYCFWLGIEAATCLHYACFLRALCSGPSVFGQDNNTHKSHSLYQAEAENCCQRVAECAGGRWFR